MRKALRLACVVALAAAGCSLDLDRLRGGQGEDAGGIDAATMDGAVAADAEMPDDAAAGDGAAGDGAADDGAIVPQDGGSDAGSRCAAACAPSARFGTPQDVALTGRPLDVKLGDVTGDGIADAVVLTSDGTVVVISAPLDDRGCSTRSLRVISTVATTSSASDLALGDADGDGRLDAAVVGTAGVLALHLGSGAGLGAAQTTSLEGTAFGVTFTGRRMHVAVGGTQGALRSFELISASLVELESVSGPALVEVTALTLPDGQPAVASSSLVAGVVLVDRIEASGPPTRVGTVSLSAGSHIAAGDLDGDGDDDLALNAIGTSRVSLVLADGADFVLAPRADASGVVDALALGAIDDDEKSDLAVVIDAAVFPYLMGDPRVPGGALLPRPGIALDGDGIDVAIGDVDGDGLPDVVVVGAAGSAHEARTVWGACP